MNGRMNSKNFEVSYDFYSSAEIFKYKQWTDKSGILHPVHQHLGILHLITLGMNKGRGVNCISEAAGYPVVSQFFRLG